VLEDQRSGKEKRARLVVTRPEPTIIGNCESWNFIVGKLAHPNSPKNAFGRSLLQCSVNFINNLSTGLALNK
jgi:hypothetical protein